MDRIMKHPSTIPFHVRLPMDCDTSEQPLTLQEIKEQLHENKYPKLQKWLDDVEDCWARVERRAALNPSEVLPPEVVLAVANRRIFEKEKRAIDILSAHNWGTELIRLRGRVTALMFDPPPKSKPFASVFTDDKVAKPPPPPIGERDLHRFVEAAELLDSEDESNEMLRIISDLQPDIVTLDARFDVSKFNAKTLNALQEYVRAMLEKRGLKFPD
jgi:hypothetical protein